MRMLEKADAKVLACTSGAVIAADAITKMLAERHLDDGRDLIAGGQLKLSHNSGVAFGGLNGAPELVVVLVVAVCVAGLTAAIITGVLGTVRVAAGVILGGALANLGDRIEGGGVTDFIDLGAWPSFNVADAALTCGLLVVVLRLGRATEAPADDAQA